MKQPTRKPMILYTMPHVAITATTHLWTAHGSPPQLQYALSISHASFTSSWAGGFMYGSVSKINKCSKHCFLMFITLNCINDTHCGFISHSQAFYQVATISTFHYSQPSNFHLTKISHWWRKSIQIQNTKLINFLLGHYIAPTQQCHGHIEHRRCLIHVHFILSNHK